MKAVCRYCAGGVGGGGVARGDHQHRHHQRGQVPGPSRWEETRFKTRALFSKKWGHGKGMGGVCASMLYSTAGSHDGGDGWRINPN